MSTKKKRAPAEDDEATEIALQRPYGRMTLGLALCGGAGGFMFYQAKSNVRGLIINGIIHLDHGQADIFYAVMGIFCLFGAALMVLNVYALATSKHFRLRIAGEVRFPFFPLWKLRRDAVVPIEELVGVELQPAQKPQHLVVVTRDARFALPVSWLPEGWSPDQVAEAVVTRARRARG